MEVFPIVGAAGFLIALLAGLTGNGTGALMAPLLLLGFPPLVVVGTVLVAVTVTRFLGAWKHLQQGTADLRLALLLGSVSGPGALMAGPLSALLGGLGLPVEGVLRRLIGVALLAVALSLFPPFLALVGRRGPPWTPPGEAPPGPLPGRGVPWGAFPLAGLLGLLVGMTSVGSGTLFSGLFLRLLPLRRAVGTTMVHGFLLALAGAVGHLGGGEVDLRLVGSILAGSLPGVLVGSGLALRVPAGALRTLVGLLLLAGGARLRA